MTPYSLTIKQTCERYGLKPTRLYELINQNQVEAVKHGTRTLVMAASVERYLAALPRLGAA